MNPYEPSDTYVVCHYDSKEEWREGRTSGIGGSDAAAALGMSKWMSNVDLWKLKTGRAVQEDLSDNPFVRYGTLAEDPLRQLYKLNHEDVYDLYYEPNVILVNIKKPYMCYSPDALLIEKETGRLGIWENKTARIYRADKKTWISEIPREYYVQILHGMNVTGAQFVELQVEINHAGWYERKTFHVERNDVLDDLKFELDGVKDFITYVQKNVEPPLWIN